MGLNVESNTSYLCEVGLNVESNTSYLCEVGLNVESNTSYLCEVGLTFVARIRHIYCKNQMFDLVLNANFSVNELDEDIARMSCER